MMGQSPEKWQAGKSQYMNILLYVIMIRKGMLILLFILTGMLYAAALSAQKKITFEFAGIIGKKGIAPGELQSPRGISVGLNGDIYIADTGNNRIQKFSSDGKFIIEKGGFGWGDEQFDRPVDIYAGRGLDIFVADMNNNRIKRYDRNLNFISNTSVENFSLESYRFRFPLGLAVSNLGDIFTIDSENNRVVKINSFGEPEMEFGGYGSSGETLIQPERIVIFRSERIYIADKGRNSIIVMDYFGNFMMNIGFGILEQPEGLTLDQEENLFVCDSELKRVLIFSNNGNMISELSDPGLTEPADIAVQGDRLYIADTANSYILMFKVIK